tara:strand:- start:2819 stop:4213 length:1395 start_codon:yes stop_codon:yes gene_type:complete
MINYNIISKTELISSRLDPEFYKKELTNLDKAIDKIGSISLRELISELTDYTANGSFASLKANVKIRDDKSFAKWIRIHNLDANNFEKSIRYTDKRGYEFLRKSKLLGGELLVSKTGEYLGRAYLFNPNVSNDKYTLADNIFLLRLKNPLYNGFVFSFINSNLGRKLLLRWSQGTGQPTIIKDSLRSVRLPEIKIEEVAIYNDLINKYYSKVLESQSLYKQAVTLLEKELGLNKIVFEKPKSYTASFSEVVNSNRADADFYQTKYKQLEKHISTLQYKSLASICNFQKGYEVGTKLYTDQGPTFIRVSNLTINGFTFGNADKYISNNTYSIFKAHKPNNGDILLTKDGTIGTCYIVDEEVEGIISSGIMNLALNDTSIPKEYLALVINSTICQMQADRDCSGALITHWKPEQIRKMKIPILSPETMEHLADLVTRSKVARKESKQLLEQAKNRVEELIEEAAKK